MSSKRELREQMALLRADVEAWRAAADRIGRHRDAAIWERNEARAMVAELTDERNAALERVAKLGDIVSDLRARVAEPESAVTTPEPRPFRVGDRVRVAEGATYKVGLSGNLASRSAGRVGVVSEVWSDGDLIIETEAESWCAASPEFCTLIEDEPEPDDDTPTPQPVTLILPDGAWVTFDAVVTR